MIWGTLCMIAGGAWLFSALEWPVRSRFSWIVACLISAGFMIESGLDRLGVLPDETPATQPTDVIPPDSAVLPALTEPAK